MKSFLSKNAVKRLMQLILGKVSEKEELMEEIGSDEVELLYKYEIAPEGELANWEHSLDDDTNVASLSKYIGTQENVIVYDKYRYNGKLYDTKLTDLKFSDSSKTTMKTFRVCDNVTEEFSQYKLGNVFMNCKSVKSIDFGSNFDLTGVYSLNSMFYMCTALETLDISGFILPNNDENILDDICNMFGWCTNLKTLILPKDPDQFYTGNVTRMIDTFNECSSLTNLNLTIFNTSSVTNMSGLVQYSTSLQSVDLSSFDTSKVTNMSYMFSNCTNLKKILVGDGWDTSAVTENTDMFTGCGVQEVTYVS